MHRIAWLLCAVAAASAWAGPLVPPPGPVASTQKTIDEAEPSTPIESLGDGPIYTITQPGAYHLTGNMTAIENVPGMIFVQAQGVSIDLRGFTIDGNFRAENLIVLQNTYCTIRNGTLREGNTSAIAGLIYQGNRVEDVNVLSCGAPNGGGFGIALGINSVVRRVNIVASGAIVTSANSIIEDVAATTQSEVVDAGPNSIVRNVTVLSNSAVASFTSVAAGAGSVLENVSIQSGQHRAITIGDYGVLRNSSVRNLSSGGGLGSVPAVEGGLGVTIENVQVSRWGSVGIQADESARVVGCVVSFVGSNGIVVGENSLVTGCRVSRVGESGIVADFGSSIEGNALRLNIVHGIVVSDDCRVADNQLDADRILVTGNDNVVDRNTITDENVPIEVTSTGNLIVRNRFSMGSLAGIPSGNDVGAISATPVGAGPWDNFTY